MKGIISHCSKLRVFEVRDGGDKVSDKMLEMVMKQVFNLLFSLSLSLSLSSPSFRI